MRPGLPVIDVSALIEAGAATEGSAADQALADQALADQALARVSGQLMSALDTSGFFYIVGHGIDAQTLNRLLNQQRVFFSLAAHDKALVAIDRDNRGYLAPGMARMRGAARHDQKEVFFWGPEWALDHPYQCAGIPLCGVNRWPGQPEGCRSAVLDYAAAIRIAGTVVLRGIARGLGLADDFFEHYYSDSLLRGQLIRYPHTTGGKDDFGVAPHTDFGCITLLHQQEPGLEVRQRDGRWVSAPPVEGSLVVNIGDLLARWSDGRLPSNLHRVRNYNDADRYSIAMFHDPNPTAIIAPADMARNKRGIPAISVADYIVERNRGAFSHHGQTKKAATRKRSTAA